MKTQVIPVLLALLAAPVINAADWPNFRGPEARGFSDIALPDEAWQEQPQFAWTAELPGRGPSSPVLVGGRVFVTSSWGTPQDHLCVLAFDAATGRELWRREFWATGRTLTHPFSAVAAPTPASDGKRIFAFYSSNDLVCLDLDGNLLWYRGLAHDWPKAGNDPGMGSSPVVVADTVVVQVENQGDSFAIGIDVTNGETRWRLERKPIASWCTPVAISANEGESCAVLLQSSSELTAHDIHSGKQLWKHEADCSTISSLVAASRQLYVPIGGIITALSLAGPTDAPQVSWESDRLRPSGGSPLLAGNRLYVITGAGVLTCADASSGKPLWQLRIPNGKGAFWSTPAIAGDHLYCFREDGTASVVRLGERGEIVGKHEFGETILASPATADGALYVRSDRHLWKIGGR